MGISHPPPNMLVALTTKLAVFVFRKDNTGFELAVQFV
jgi:hypothetical protein